MLFTRVFFDEAGFLERITQGAIKKKKMEHG